MLRLLANVDLLLATILVVNNLVNICIVILTAGIIDSVFTFLRFEFLFKTVLVTFLLLLFGVKRPFGIFLARFGIKVPMTWWSAVFAAAVVSFPLMYRTARGAFEAFDEDLADAGRTLGLSNPYIFWRVRMPCCRQGILAGTVLQAGLGKMNPAAVPALLQSKDRRQAGPTLPARGLFLWDVQYPDLERPND